MVEPVDDPAEVADAVAVRVLIRAGVDLVQRRPRATSELIVVSHWRNLATHPGYGRRVVIKYLGSKRRLVPVLGEMFAASGGGTALDLFTGTTRVAQEFKRRGGVVTAVDTARYSEVFAALLHRDRRATRSTSTRSTPSSSTARRARRHARLLHRDVLPRVALPPARERRAGRRDPRRDRRRLPRTRRCSRSC